MEQSKTLTNVSSLEEFSKSLKNESSSLNGMIDELLKLTEDMEKFFNTPTSRLFKESLISFLTNSKKKANNLDLIGDNVHEISLVYANTVNNNEKAVNG